MAIDEEVRNVAEQIDYFERRCDRVAHTMEISDFLGWRGGAASLASAEALKENVAVSPKLQAPLYDLGPLPDHDAKEGTAALEKEGLSGLIDRLHQVNPAFTVVTELCELDDENFEVRDYQRPPGYSATSRVHVGRLCVPTLHDSGATCCCITEEQVVLIVNHTQRMLVEASKTTTTLSYSSTGTRT